MATKNNPGAFDCYANATPDEPMFVLLGRDRHAPILVRLWAELRRRDGEDLAKVVEAVSCASSMVQFASEQGKQPLDPVLCENLFQALVSVLNFDASRHA